MGIPLPWPPRVLASGGVVRLSITRRGGQHAWGPVSGDFERSVAAQAGSAVIEPRVDGETARTRSCPGHGGHDHRVRRRCRCAYRSMAGVQGSGP